MKFKKRLKKLTPWKRIRARNADLQPGDVIYTPLYGIFRHYGIVIERSPTGNHTVRTVHRDLATPLNQTLEEFSAGKKVYRKTQKPGKAESATRALEEQNFSYNVLINNCENFVRRAQGKTDISLQSVAGIGVLGASIAIALLRKRRPKI